MFGLNPMTLYVFAFLLFTNLMAVVLWRSEAASHKATKAEHAEKLVKMHEQQLGYINEALSFNDQLVAQLVEYEKLLSTKEKEKRDAIVKATKGVRCFDAPAVRVLNNLPGPPDGQAEPYPVSEDGSFATDTDVGTWIVDAQKQYDTCRGRIDKIADFYEGMEKKKND